MRDEVGRDLRFKKLRIRDESQIYRTLIILKTVWLDMKTINLTRSLLIGLGHCYSYINSAVLGA